MTDRENRPPRWIGEPTAELRLNARNLRYCEAIGLLHPSRRTSSGQRLAERRKGA
ncbi:MAG: MerR family DNA-binding transcriptional regulator [Thermoflexus sp.]|jgi:hypothetical protein|nr:MerR family DNA-binding transcriptional regulator [Thermoflexus sp.]